MARVEKSTGCGSGRRRQRWGKWSMGASLVVLTSLIVTTPGESASRHINWPSYLLNSHHTGYQSAATAITPSNASKLTVAWRWPVGVLSSPTVYDGVIYIGANNGNFYALNEATGSVLWEETIGTQPVTNCEYGGFVSTAAVATDPSTGKLTVYVGTPTGYLDAFDAATGAIDWSAVIAIPSATVTDYFDYSSPAIVNGKIYVGISSNCDNPLVRGGLISFDQGTGARLATFYTVPAGDIGGSVWSSPAVDPAGNVWITTGNGPHGNGLLGDSESIIELNGSTLDMIGHWQIPLQPTSDSDFGGSPTLFSAVLPGHSRATGLVGACNKNGTYYVLNRHDPDAGPVWTQTAGGFPTGPGPNQCIQAANYDGSNLFEAGPTATIGGVQYPSQVQEFDPATGAVKWETGLGGGIDGSSSLDGAGVLSVATFGTHKGVSPADYLLDAANGSILTTINTGDGAEFSQPVFADQYLFLGTFDNLTAYTLPSGS